MAQKPEYFDPTSHTDSPPNSPTAPRGNSSAPSPKASPDGHAGRRGDSSKDSQPGNPAGGIPGNSAGPPLSGQLLVLAAAVLWGTSGTAQALAPEAATSAMVGTARIMISGLVLILCAAVEGRLRPWRTFMRPIFLLTGLTQALFQVTYFGGIAYTGVAVGTMVAIGSCPIYAGILGVVLDKERLSGRWLFATVIALTGLLILMLDDGEKVHIDVRGLLLALAAGFSYTFFTWMARRLVKVMPVDSVLAVSFVVGSVFLLPVLYLEPLGWIGTSRGVSVVLYLGLISAGLAYMLYGRGLRTVPVSSVGTLTLGEPLTAALLGIFFLGELLSVASAAGIALIFTAQLVLVLPSYKTLRRTLGTHKGTSSPNTSPQGTPASKHTAHQKRSTKKTVNKK